MFESHAALTVYLKRKHDFAKAKMRIRVQYLYFVPLSAVGAQTIFQVLEEPGAHVCISELQGIRTGIFHHAICVAVTGAEMHRIWTESSVQNWDLHVRYFTLYFGTACPVLRT